MFLAGFSINNLTLMALTIGTGFVVDDAIVMIENIARHVDAGHAPLEAALRGSREIAFTIISLTGSLIAVLIPLLFMGDIVGRLFREFAATLAVAILLSAAVSLSFTPMLCARLLRRSPGHGNDGGQGGILGRVIELYCRALRRVLAHRAVGFALALAALGCTLLLAWIVPKGFFPVQDTGVIEAITEAPPSISFAAMAERQQALARRFLDDPAVESLSSVVGVDGVNATLNSGRLLVNLQPYPVRTESATEVIARLRESSRAVSGIGVFLQPVQDLTVEDRVGRTPFRFTLETPDEEALMSAAPVLLAKLRGLPELDGVTSDLQTGGRKATVDVDRDSAGRLGVSMAAVDDALYSAFGQRFVSTIFTQTTQYRVVLETLPEFRRGPEALRAIYVTGANGRQVPLSAIATVKEAPTVLAVNREMQFPAVTVSFDLAPGISLGRAIEAIESEKEALGLPPSLQTHFQGTALAFRGALRNEAFLMVAALATMYVVLGALYESFIHPLTILSTLPSASVGALLALLLTRTELTVVAIIGIVLLVGIVQKNAIMILDFALEAQRRDGQTPEEAIHRACLLRFRPILMTTMAALLSAIPLALATGPGAELRRPLGIAMVGGLLLSQLVTLFTTPVVYLAFEAVSRSFAARSSREARVAAAGDAMPS
jgi:multidrug efflux pump